VTKITHDQINQMTLAQLNAIVSDKTIASTDAATIIIVADAVRSHVQGCFDTEYAKCVLIDAAQTVEDVEAVAW